jgi:hypothetical protein
VRFRRYLPLASLAALSAATLSVLASRVHDWIVMTDELQYAKLATNVAETVSPLPTLRGVHVAAYAQLYPVLLSPLFGTLSAPSAFHAAHWLNGVLFASASVPAYLLARELALTRSWSLLCAALCVAVPWNVQTAFVMTESAAYPVFLWTMLAFVGAIVKPSRRRDAVAIAAVLLAVLARTQFLVLGLVLPLSALLVEGRRAIARHHVLAVASVVGLVIVVVFRSRLLGSYSVVASGSILPWRAVERAGAHLDAVGVGIGLLPLLVGGAWLVANGLRRSPPALLALVTVVALTLEASSYDVRVGGGLAGIRSRYLFYVAPLLLIAMVRALKDSQLPVIPVAGVTAFVVVTVVAHDFPRVSGLYVDAPEALLNGVIREWGGGAFVAMAAVVLTLALTVLRLPPKVLAPSACALVFAFSAGTAAAAWQRLLGSHGPSGRLITDLHGLVLDWVDRALPSGSDVAILPYPTSTEWSYSALRWWDVELWNRSVDRAYRIGATWDYAPFPALELRADASTGVVAGTVNAPSYVVASEIDSRLRLAGAAVAENSGLDVLHVPRPYRLLWQSHGLDPDGWTRPGRRAWIHVFPEPGTPSYVQITISLEGGAQMTAQLCRSGNVPLPDKLTGTAPPLPLGPGKEGVTRRVGVHLLHVELTVGQQC